MKTPLTWGLVLAMSLCGGAPVIAESIPHNFDKGMLALGRGDYAEAYYYWLPLAEKGYTEAQYHVGWLYANGNGLAVNIEQALTWWMRAAEQGHADAQFAVGLAHTTGEGLKMDLHEAVKWFLRAAHQGHRDARDIILRLNGDPSLDMLETHPEVAEEAWFGWPGTVTRDKINVRAGPGTRHKIVDKLEKGTEVRVVGRRGDWWMVVLPNATKGEYAWIYKSLLSSASR